MDAASGGHRLALDGWWLVAPASSPVESSVLGEPLLVRDGSGLETVVAVLDPAARRVMPVGRIHAVQRYQCLVDERYLVCPTVANAVGVWRYRLPPR